MRFPRSIDINFLLLFIQIFRLVVVAFHGNLQDTIILRYVGHVGEIKNRYPNQGKYES